MARKKQADTFNTEEPPEIEETIKRATKAVQRSKDKNFNRNDYLMLSQLRTLHALSYMAGVTIREWIDADKDTTEKIMSDRQARRKIKEYIDKGYVKRGVDDAQSYSYYITKKGLDILTEMEAL